jgi:DNA-binding NarL/FixJ family response regulator
LTFKAFVVEDNVAIRDSLVETLAELAGIVIAGVTGNQKAAVAWLTDPVNEWDVAIVDLVLEQGGSGLEVLRAIQNRKATQKMVVLSGAAGAEMRSQCEALGVDGIFDKSMDTDALLDYCVALARR